VKKVEFYRHSLSHDDKQELLSVVDSVFLTTGNVVKRFETAFATYMGSQYAVGVTSCTHALELALRSFGIGHGDEVITTPLSFVATANTIEYVGAKPVFVDVEASTGNIDATLIEQAITPRTRALMIVHLYGQMCDMKAIRKIADRHNLKVIEDSAHCVEGTRDGVKPGQVGDIACFSFYATKNLTSGEGGALVCNDEKLYDWLLQGRLHGMTKGAADRYHGLYQHYDVPIVGMKCNMSNLQAALLVNQLGRLDDLLKQRAAIVERYEEAFSFLPTVTRHETLSGVHHAYHLYTIMVDQAVRDTFLHELQHQGVGVAVNFRPIHLMSYYRSTYDYKEGDFPVAERIGASTITLPLYPKLTDEEIAMVISAVKTAVKQVDK